MLAFCTEIPFGVVLFFYATVEIAWYVFYSMVQRNSVKGIEIFNQ